MKRQVGGFTLIELLIVVAIIAILAAIAVPNFLEAQVRSKVSRCKTDQRSVATALESYFVDFNDYPYAVVVNPAAEYNYVYTQFAPALSTPVAYMTSTIVVDPFSGPAVSTRWGAAPTDWKATYLYINYSDYWARQNAYFNSEGIGLHKAFGVGKLGPQSLGTTPDAWPAVEWYPYYAVWHQPHSETAEAASGCMYDSSNGTKSRGSIARFGGDVAGMAQTY